MNPGSHDLDTNMLTTRTISQPIGQLVGVKIKENFEHCQSASFVFNPVNYCIKKYKDFYTIQLKYVNNQNIFTWKITNINAKAGGDFSFLITRDK